ncbi:MAG: twin transmembrane helix small protein [Gammaproteobacteria bacterium]|nr:MAG: twin transmembrane helix small protein [Gammaproteobacteria bacterium]
MIKTLILLNLLLILVSLFSGMFFLVKDDQGGKRLVTSLTFRVSLSFSLIALLLIGYFTGQIQPHGV